MAGKATHPSPTNCSAATRKGARQEQEAGLPKLRKLAEGAEDAYPDDNYHADMNDYPAEPVSPDHTAPLDESDDYQHDRPTPARHSRANGNPQAPFVSSAPSAGPTGEVLSRPNGEFPALSVTPNSASKERPKRKTPSP